MRAIRRFIVQPVLPEPLEPLHDLALNLRWAWHPETQELFESLDSELWEATGHSPLKLLATVSRERLDTLAGDRRYLRHLEFVQRDLDDYMNGDRWFQGFAAKTEGAPASIGYFSAEFGITSVLPQYLSLIHI